MRGNLCIEIICCQRSSAISKKMMKDECNESSTENVCKLPSTTEFIAVRIAISQKLQSGKIFTVENLI